MWPQITAELFEKCIASCVSSIPVRFETREMSMIAPMPDRKLLYEKSLGQGLIFMELGPFSICLAVKDLEASKSFYEKLGFSAISPDPEHKNWHLMKNGET